MAYPIEIRLADATESAALASLAQLDSRSGPVGDVLVAVVDGEIVAALPLAGGEPIADPFRPTAAIVALLRTRAAQLEGAVAPSAHAFRRRLRARAA